MKTRTHLLVWLTLASWVARKMAAASLPARAALWMRQFPKRQTNFDFTLYFFKRFKMTLSWFSTTTCRTRGCPWSMRVLTRGVRSVGVAPSLDESCRKAVLVKWGAVHDWSVIVEGVNGGIRRYCNVLQGQPQGGVPLVVFQIHVQSEHSETSVRLRKWWKWIQCVCVWSSGEGILRSLFALQELVEHGFVPWQHCFV